MWPCGCVVVFTFEVTEAFEAGRATGGEANGGDEPVDVDFGTVRAFDKPLLTLLAEDGVVNILVVYDVFGCAVFFFDVVEVALEFA